MTWEQKLQALNRLAPCRLVMRSPGDWYVEQRTALKTHGSQILWGAFGNGSSPEAAVNNHWHVLTELAPADYVVVNAMSSSNRRAVVWNGCMWDSVEERPS